VLTAEQEIKDQNEEKDLSKKFVVVFVIFFGAYY